MRHSTEPPNDAIDRCPPQHTNAEFFRRVADRSPPAARRGALLLVGGRDPLALAVRRAQGLLRYDRRPSYWSHAALLLGWPGDPAGAFGVEVALDARSARHQTPERNGVTSFRLARYLNKSRYPNLGVFLIEFAPDAAASTPERAPDAPASAPEYAPDVAAEGTRAARPSRGLSDVIAAALEPNRERTRYPWWDNLAPWARYAYAPDATPNPLLEGVPLPAASLCEYAYGAAGIDLVPGATANHTCPELLWATMRRWARRLEDIGALRINGFAVLRDPHATPLAESPSLADELREALGEASS
jgi:hypothetical protein